jgi:hypothetical protein
MTFDRGGRSGGRIGGVRGSVRNEPASPADPSQLRACFAPATSNALPNHWSKAVSVAVQQVVTAVSLTRHQGFADVVWTITSAQMLELRTLLKLSAQLRKSRAAVLRHNASNLLHLLAPRKH